MIFTETKLQGAFRIDMQKREDDRGYFARAFCKKEFADHGLVSDFEQTNMSLCRFRGTIRGLHYQLPPHGEVKLMRCINGAIVDVIVDLRPDSPTFRQYHIEELTDQNRRMLYCPENFAHAYQALTDDAEVIYSASRSYVPGAERGLRWNDPTLGIRWPIMDKVIVSDKDANWPDLDDNAIRAALANVR